MIGPISDHGDIITGMRAQPWPMGSFESKRDHYRPENTNSRTETERLTTDFREPSIGPKYLRPDSDSADFHSAVSGT